MTEEVDVPALIKIVKEQWRKERDRADLMEKSFTEQCKHTDKLNEKLSAERAMVDQLDVLALKRAQDRADFAEAELGGRDEIIDELQHQVMSAGDICSLAQDSMRKAEARAEQLAEDKTKLNMKLSAEVTRSEELTAANRHLRTDCASYSATIKDLNSYIDSVRKSLLWSRNRADKAEAELAELKEQQGPAFPPGGVTRTEYGMAEIQVGKVVLIRLVGTGKSAMTVATHSREVTTWVDSGPNDYWARYTSAWTKMENRDD